MVAPGFAPRVSALRAFIETPLDIVMKALKLLLPGFHLSYAVKNALVPVSGAENIPADCNDKKGHDRCQGAPKNPYAW